MIIEKKVVINNRMGLHARPAAMFVQIANKFDCDIMIKRGNQKVNGKSIMGILTLAANKGAKVLLRAEGPDSEVAIAKLEKLLSGELDDVLFKEIIPRTKKDVSRKGGLISAEEKEKKEEDNG
ncbi:MAG: HPr family phosphocarrier protein [Candidatus Omnitrophica bacterium]|nr:HPr family phosphocarrier protein [Candidatus Omnitrophota bacterium]